MQQHNLMDAGQNRIHAIDWMRGFVMILMTIDHVGNMWDTNHFHADSVSNWIPGSLLPTGEFLTRWITHLCAPTFILLAGTALALSFEKRKNQTGQTAFIVKRGFLMVLLDVIWMPWGLSKHHLILLQILFAIGLSLICMAWLRRFSSSWLFILAISIQVLNELSMPVHFSSLFLSVIWKVLCTGGVITPTLIVVYPLLPWLSLMILGCLLGRWMIETPQYNPKRRARILGIIGIALLVIFLAVRGFNGYGNFGLYRDSMGLLQWLHVSKYPPSLSYTTLELGLAFLLLAVFFRLNNGKARIYLKPLEVLGSTALFYYIIHAHLASLGALLTENNSSLYGLFKTYIVALIILGALYPFCLIYKRYKTNHPNGWTRYL